MACTALWHRHYLNVYTYVLVLHKRQVNISEKLTLHGCPAFPFLTTFKTVPLHSGTEDERDGRRRGKEERREGGEGVSDSDREQESQMLKNVQCTYARTNMHAYMYM